MSRFDPYETSAANFTVRHNTALIVVRCGPRPEGERVRRREFITLGGGAAIAWPLTARAQQEKRMRRVGVLMPYAANDPQAQTRNAAFLQALQQLGWTVGNNVQIDYRWSAGSEGQRCSLDLRAFPGSIRPSNENAVKFTMSNRSI